MEHTGLTCEADRRRRGAEKKPIHEAHFFTKFQEIHHAVTYPIRDGLPTRRIRVKLKSEMDNLTHSLIGAAIARSLPKKFRRPEIYWASILGNNAPDVDFLIPYLPGTDFLDYLVHHRGYTHTFLLAPVMGILSAVIAKKITRADRWTLSLFVVAIFGCFTHIGADFMNNYGVHPLSPFLNRWFYGDSIFIVEPTIWFALIPFIAREAERNWARVGWWILGFAMLILIWIFPSFSTSLAAMLSGFFIACLTLAFYLDSRFARLTTTLFLFVAVYAGFYLGGAYARKTARGAWQSATEGTETWIDTESTPLPGNPLCWSVWIASKNTDEFRFRSATVSLWPGVVSTIDCDPMPIKIQTAELRPVTFASGPSIRWLGDSRLPFTDWKSYRAKSPTFRRFIAFARYPFIKHLPDGSAIVGDLRYDREAGLGFSEFRIPTDEKDGPSRGPWISPLE